MSKFLGDDGAGEDKSRMSVRRRGEGIVEGTRTRSSTGMKGKNMTRRNSRWLERKNPAVLFNPKSSRSIHENL